MSCPFFFFEANPGHAILKYVNISEITINSTHNVKSVFFLKICPFTHCEICEYCISVIFILSNPLLHMCPLRNERKMFNFLQYM